MVSSCKVGLKNIKNWELWVDLKGNAKSSKKKEKFEPHIKVGSGVLQEQSLNVLRVEFSIPHLIKKEGEKCLVVLLFAHVSNFSSFQNLREFSISCLHYFKEWAPILIIPLFTISNQKIHILKVYIIRLFNLSIKHVLR